MARIRLRKIVSRRSLATVAFVSVLAVSLHVLVLQHFPLEFHLDPDSTFPHFDWELPFGRGRQRPLGNHTYTPDGLLVVNPDGPHPIFQLIRDAEAEWDAKCARASKTLGEAVAEYRRRYRRAPPRGFDKWWDYVIKHRVRLPDEYDQIFENIEPFWGIDPHELAETQKELETQRDVITFEKTDVRPRIDVVSSTIPPGRKQELQGRIEDILALTRDVERNLPPLRISFSPFDNPGMVSDWKIKSMALEAAANGTTLVRADLPPVEQGWLRACPPDSPARLHPPIYPPPAKVPMPPSTPKTFIASHRDTMDPCKNPSLLLTHGEFLRHEIGPFPQRTLVPRFSLCATMLHHDIIPPVSYGWAWESASDAGKDADEDEGEGEGAFEGDVPWQRKTSSKLGWRGRTTGMYASPETWWANGHRARLVSLTSALEGNVSVLSVPTVESRRWTGPSRVGEPETVSLAEVNRAWMDVAFTDRPIACDEDRGTCDEMARMWTFRDVQQRDEEGRYKFILDVDGNGWSGRFKRLVTSNALVFKATIYPEWYTSRIVPWVHYVPVQVSYSDLYDVVSFFRVHDSLGRKIARAGRAWSRRYWRKEDMTAYLYRLLLEYARVTSLDRSAMDYVG